MSEDTLGKQLSDTSPSNDSVLAATGDDGDFEDFHEVPESALVGVLTTRSEFRGPIPHPQLLKQYDEALPGSAERILRMAEQEQEHRFKIVSQCIDSDTKESKLGLHYSFILGLAPMVLGIVIVIVGRNESSVWVGGLFGVSGLATVIATMLKSSRASWKPERKTGKSE